MDIGKNVQSATGFKFPFGVFFLLSLKNWQQQTTPKTAARLSESRGLVIYEIAVFPSPAFNCVKYSITPGYPDGKTGLKKDRCHGTFC